MHRFWIWSAIFFLTLIGFSEVLVLQNGQKIVAPNGFEVQGDWVVFLNQEGELFQLTASRVDFEKTKKARSRARGTP